MRDDRIGKIALRFLEGTAKHGYRKVFGRTIPNIVFFGKPAQDGNLNGFPTLLFLLANEFVKYRHSILRLQVR